MYIQIIYSLTSSHRKPYNRAVRFRIILEPDTQNQETSDTRFHFCLRTVNGNKFDLYNTENAILKLIFSLLCRFY